MNCVSVYVRHSAGCPKKSDPLWKRCKCPKHLYVYRDGKRLRQSARTRSWEKAEEKKRLLEEQLEEGRELRKGPVTVQEAVKRFLDAKAQANLQPASLSKLKLLLEKHLQEWCKAQGIVSLSSLHVKELEEFRASWKDAALSRKKKQERLRSFFGYCRRMDLIKTNPALGLERILVTDKPTDYFTPTELNSLLDATHLYPDRTQAIRIRALIGLMRWSGLAIRDAISLERSRLNDRDEVFLYRAKTGVPVYVPIPPVVAQGLRDVPPGPRPDPRYFFWSGNGLVKSAVADWQRSFRRLVKLSGIKKRAHFHMLRDTFAVELLLAGVPLDQVSILLGHSSIKITEKHYAPFVKARQEQLTQSVRQSWI